MDYKKKIVVWGIGKRSKYVFDSLLFDECELVSCVDKIKKAILTIHNTKYIVNDIETINELVYDYLIISMVDIIEIENDAFKDYIDKSNIIYFWN